jgi:hypothetical protein
MSTARYIDLHPDDPWSWARVIHRELPDFPGYCVGTDGSVWSCRARNREGGRWRRLNPTAKSSKGSAYSKLILETFIGPRPFAKAECRHLDGNACNNNVMNLAWGTRRENEEDKVTHGTLMRGERHPNSKLTRDDADEIIRLKGLGLTHAAIGHVYGITISTVGDIMTGRTWRNRPVIDIPADPEDDD